MSHRISEFSWANPEPKQAACPRRIYLRRWASFDKPQPDGKLSASLQFFEQFFPARPSLVARFLVSFPSFRVIRFARAHEPVTRIFVDHRLIFFAGGLHQRSEERRVGK